MLGRPQKGLRPVRGVDALHHGAGLEVPASVADARGRREPLAGPLHEVAADLEALPCHPDRRPAQQEGEFYALPVLDRHLSCHDGIPFVAFASLPRTHVRSREAAAG